MRDAIHRWFYEVVPRAQRNLRRRSTRVRVSEWAGRYERCPARSWKQRYFHEQGRLRLQANPFDTYVMSYCVIKKRGNLLDLGRCRQPERVFRVRAIRPACKSSQ